MSESPTAAWDAVFGGKVIIELKNGQRFTYVNWTGAAIIDNLQALGVRQIGIKNTYHVIPRGTVDAVCAHGHALDMHCCACKRSGFFPPTDCTC